MANLNTLEKQLANTESQLSQYSADLPSQIESQIQKAYTPALQQSLGTTKDLMGDYLGRYFETTGMGPGMAGTTALDLSPTQKLGVMGRELGTMSGELQATQRFSDYLGGQMSDMYNKALQAMQMGQQNLADQYSRQFQQYQLAWQEAEAAKDRAMQASIAAQQYKSQTPYTYRGETKPQEEDDIIVPGKVSWTDKAYSALAKPIANNRTGITNNPFTTGTNLLGNLVGNWGTNKTFLDKLLNR